MPDHRGVGAHLFGADVAGLEIERGTLGLLEAHGLAAPIAAIRARLLCTSLVGEQHVSLKLSRKRRVEWALQNLESLLIRQ